MRLRFDPSEIKALADRYLSDLSKTEYDEEVKIINLKETVQQAKCLTSDQLKLVGSWKTERVSKFLLKNTDGFTEQTTKRAFENTDNWGKLKTLTDLYGVGHARASAILHLYDKKIYPILDMHAMFSIGLKRESKPYYRKNFWLEYVLFFRDIVSDHNIADHRQLDRALWRYSYEQMTS